MFIEQNKHLFLASLEEKVLPSSIPLADLLCLDDMTPATTVRCSSGSSAIKSPAAASSSCGSSNIMASPQQALLMGPVLLEGSVKKKSEMTTFTGWGYVEQKENSPAINRMEALVTTAAATTTTGGSGASAEKHGGGGMKKGSKEAAPNDRKRKNNSSSANGRRVTLSPATARAMMLKAFEEDEPTVFPACPFIDFDLGTNEPSPAPAFSPSRPPLVRSELRTPDIFSNPRYIDNEEDVAMTMEGIVSLDAGSAAGSANLNDSFELNASHIAPSSGAADVAACCFESLNEGFCEESSSEVDVDDASGVATASSGMVATSPQSTMANSVTAQQQSENAILCAMRAELDDLLSSNYDGGCVAAGGEQQEDVSPFAFPPITASSTGSGQELLLLSPWSPAPPPSVHHHRPHTPPIVAREYNFFDNTPTTMSEGTPGAAGSAEEEEVLSSSPPSTAEVVAPVATAASMTLEDRERSLSPLLFDEDSDTFMALERVACCTQERVGMDDNVEEEMVEQLVGDTATTATANAAASDKELVSASMQQEEVDITAEEDVMALEKAVEVEVGGIAATNNEVTPDVIIPPAVEPLSAAMEATAMSEPRDVTTLVVSVSPPMVAASNSSDLETFALLESLVEQQQQQQQSGGVKPFAVFPTSGSVALRSFCGGSGTPSDFNGLDEVQQQQHEADVDEDDDCYFREEEKEDQLACGRQEEKGDRPTFSLFQQAALRPRQRHQQRLAERQQEREVMDMSPTSVESDEVAPAFPPSSPPLPDDAAAADGKDDIGEMVAAPVLRSHSLEASAAPSSSSAGSDGAAADQSFDFVFPSPLDYAAAQDKAYRNRLVRFEKARWQYQWELVSVKAANAAIVKASSKYQPK